MSTEPEVQPESAAATAVVVAETPVATEQPVTAAEEEIKKTTTWVAKKAADVKLEADDKLIFSELENAFLREQIKLNEAVANIEKMRAHANKIIAGFAQRYGIDPAKHVFSDVERAFKAL